MAVIVGSARSDEFGNIKGGKAGDQTGKEVSTQNWYLHSKGWRVFRAKDPVKADMIAWDMQSACNNPNIGYDQSENTSLFNIVKKLGFNCAKVTTPCETDCSQLVRVCVRYAGINVGDFYTATEAAALMATGAFTELTDHRFTTSGLYLERGDILVTKTAGHTVVVLTDGSAVTRKDEFMFSVEPISKGKKGKDVLLCQKLLKVDGYKGSDGRVLQLDGDCGDNTVYAINSFQSAMRKQGIELGTNGQNDGCCGTKCWKYLLDI